MRFNRGTRNIKGFDGVLMDERRPEENEGKMEERGDERGGGCSNI